MNQSSHLYQLQKIDSEMDRCRNRIREINQILEADQSVRLAEQQVSDFKKTLHKAQLTLRNIEENVRSIQMKINLSESNLYRGSIRNPKELKDLQDEIASLKRRLSVLEDEQLEAMLAVEDVENNLQTSTVQLTEIQAQAVAKQATLIGEKSQIEKSNERLQAERQATVGSIMQSNLEIYEVLRKQKRGIAVATISDEACTACGAELRPAEIQLARAPQNIAYCSSCSRILYAG